MPVITWSKARLKAQTSPQPNWAPLWCIASVALVFLILHL